MAHYKMPSIGLAVSPNVFNKYKNLKKIPFWGIQYQPVEAPAELPEPDEFETGFNEFKNRPVTTALQEAQ